MVSVVGSTDRTSTWPLWALLLRPPASTGMFKWNGWCSLLAMDPNLLGQKGDIHGINIFACMCIKISIVWKWFTYSNGFQLRPQVFWTPVAMRDCLCQIQRRRSNLLWSSWGRFNTSWALRFSTQRWDPWEILKSLIVALTFKVDGLFVYPRRVAQTRGFCRLLERNNFSRFGFSSGPGLFKSVKFETRWLMVQRLLGLRSLRFVSGNFRGSTKTELSTVIWTFLTRGGLNPWAFAMTLTSQIFKLGSGWCFRDLQLRPLLSLRRCLCWSACFAGGQASKAWKHRIASMDADGWFTRGSLDCLVGVAWGTKRLWVKA